MNELPSHAERYVGDNDLFLDIYEGDNLSQAAEGRPPLLFVPWRLYRKLDVEQIHASLHS